MACDGSPTPIRVGGLTRLRRLLERAPPHPLLQVAEYVLDLRQRGPEVVGDLLGDDVRVGRTRGVLQALVPEPGLRRLLVGARRLRAAALGRRITTAPGSRLTSARRMNRSREAVKNGMNGFRLRAGALFGEQGPQPAVLWVSSCPVSRGSLGPARRQSDSRGDGTQFLCSSRRLVFYDILEGCYHRPSNHIGSTDVLSPAELLDRLQEAGLGSQFEH